MNGLQGYTAIARDVPLPWGNRGPARFAVVYYNNMAYVFRGSTRLASALPASDPLFLSSIKTFRRLKDNEFALAEPKRIQLLKADATDANRARWRRARPSDQYPAERCGC